MRILFVAMAQSVHLARWMAQLHGLTWDLHLFPADWPCGIHPDLRDVTLHGTGWWRHSAIPDSLPSAGHWPFPHGGYTAQKWGERLAPGCFRRERQLAVAIRCLQPDLVHCLEMQHGGYLLLGALETLRQKAPKILYSCWGNDIYYFGRQPEHASRIRAFLERCDFFMADCYRDIGLARQFGFRGEDMGYFPGPGGFLINDMMQRRQPGPSSARRVLAVKGYDHWGGRALLALRAMDRCRELLREYKIVVYSATATVRAVAEHLRNVGGLNIEVLDHARHEVIVSLMGSARIALAVSVTDGTPNSMLEAMVMGACPVQSDTVSTAEWIKHGVNGILVDPDNEPSIDQGLRRALQDDRLVDRAAEQNLRITRQRIDMDVVLPRVTSAYEYIHRSVVAR